MLIFVFLLDWPTWLSFSVKSKWTWPTQYVPHASAPWVDQISTAAAHSIKDENLADTPYFPFLAVNVVFCWKSRKPLVSIARQWPFSFCLHMVAPLCVVVVVWSLLSCVWLFCDPMDCSPPGSSVHGISQVRILEWVAMPTSSGSSQLRDWSWVSRIVGRLYHLSHQGSYTFPIIFCSGVSVEMWGNECAWSVTWNQIPYLSF